MENKVKEKTLAFFKKGKPVTFKKGEQLLKPNEAPQGVFCLIRGSVRMYSASKKGVETTLNIFKPISLFPMGWVINNTSNVYSYEATATVKVYIAQKSEVLTFLKKEPSVVYDLLSRIFKGLDGFFMRMESILSGNAYQRVITQLIIQMRRFGKADLSHSKIASLSGLSRETVTRQMQKLQRKGIALYKGKSLKIVNITKLEQELL